MKLSEKKLNFYKNMYNQIEKLEKLYKDYFSLKKIKADIVASKFVLNNQEKEKEYEELVALESVILATLIGLNREKLEKANSEVNGRTLFQYKDYESSMKIFFSENYYKNGFDVSKDMCKELNFNPDKKGPFPYMIEIIQDDSKNRPYDYISKIRNALLHGEYYLETPEILHITNHDENGNITFEGKVLMFSFEMFVIDFFGINGVNSSFPLYNFLNIEEFKTMDDFVLFFREFVLYEFKFTKIPQSYKFTGKDALYTKLNNCFALGGIESKDITKEISNMEKEGLEYIVTGYKLTDDQIINIYEYLMKTYKNIFNNKEIVKHLHALIKLQLQPISEITNCLGNMITYISCKKDYLMNESNVNKKFLDELKYDEYCNTAFKFALTLLKANIISYAIECEEFEDVDFSLLDIKDVNIDDINEFNRRKNNLLLEGLDKNIVETKLVLETIRNSLAHGADRIKVSIEKDLKTYLLDIYPNIPNLGLEASLETLNKLFSSKIFRPENIKLKEEQKILKKI